MAGIVTCISGTLTSSPGNRLSNAFLQETFAKTIAARILVIQNFFITELVDSTFIVQLTYHKPFIKSQASMHTNQSMFILLSGINGIIWGKHFLS
jgi:lysophospholipase L1-like esterase